MDAGNTMRKREDKRGGRKLFYREVEDMTVQMGEREKKTKTVIRFSQQTPEAMHLKSAIT